MEPIAEAELETAQPKFMAEWALAVRVGERDGRRFVRLGEMSRGHYVVNGVILLVIIVAVVLLIRAGILPPWAAFFPFIGIITVYMIFLERQRRLNGLEIELQPKRCVLRSLEGEEIVENIQAVVVVNSHRLRDGTPAIDGVSELFLRVERTGRFWFVPLVCDSNYGEFDNLGRIIANAVHGELVILNH